MSDTRPVASLSLDLDNLWSYQKIHGDAGWEAHGSYLDACVPLVLEAMRKRALTITVFIVGQDAAIGANGAALRALADAGHEIGNHSFHHEPWLHLYPRAQIQDELARAEESIEGATGRRPIGFRGPGFSLSAEVLEVLAERGYLYDASTFPTFIGPLARAYYFWHARDLSPEERAQRKKLFGTVKEGLRPLRPYVWETGSRALVEIPVTTMPIARAPFHMSYLVWLSRYSRPLALAYLDTAMLLCRLRGVAPSFLLHPLDFLGADAVSELAFFPGMDRDTGTKLGLLDRVLARLGRSYQLVPMAEHARAVLASGAAPARAVPAGA